jgi:hypothetical protein
VRRRLLIVAVALGLTALTVAAFAPVARCDFIDMDDLEYVVNNPDVLGGLNADSACWAFTTVHASNWHPLTWLSLQLDAQFYGQNAVGYHLTNLALHAAAVVLLFLVLCDMTRCVWRSAAVAAFFGVHPLHVESVAWVTERKDVLSALFWMLTMAAYVKYARRPCVPRYLLVVLSLALGLSAKPMLVTLPFVLCLLDYWPLCRVSSVARFTQLRPRLALLFWEKVPLFLLAGVASVLTYAAQTNFMVTLAELPLTVRLANAVVTYATYLAQVFWPSGLVILYTHASTIAWGQVAGAGALLLAVSLLALLQCGRRPYIIVGWLWYLGTLVPVIGFVQVGGQAHADRYTYIPLIGVFMMAAWGLPDLLARLRRPAVVLAPCAAVLLAGCVVCTWLQLRHWQNARTIWEHVVAVDPRCARAYHALSFAYEREGRLDDAIDCIRKAVELAPSATKYRSRLVALLQNTGQRQAADKEFVIMVEMMRGHNVPSGGGENEVSQ